MTDETSYSKENAERLRLEQKLGFDRIREAIAAKCSTEYAAGRVADENFSTSADEIQKRLRLTDEMRMIMMFEESFPTNGYIDAIGFLRPLEKSSVSIDLLSLRKLKTVLETLRRLTSFFEDVKDGIYPNLKRMASGVMNFSEVQRRIDSILEKYSEIRHSVSDDP